MSPRGTYWLAFSVTVTLIALSLWLWLTSPTIPGIDLVTLPMAEGKKLADQFTGRWNVVRELARIVAARPDVPFGVALAIVEHESNFNPEATNEKTGAAGLWQILPAYFRDYKVNAYTARQIAGSSQGALDYLARYWSRINEVMPGSDLRTRYAAVYFGHAEGIGALWHVLGAVAAANATAPTWDEFCAIAAAAWDVQNRLAGMDQAAGKALWWDSQRAELTEEG